MLTRNSYHWALNVKSRTLTSQELDETKRHTLFPYCGPVSSLIRRIAIQYNLLPYLSPVSIKPSHFIPFIKDYLGLHHPMGIPGGVEEASETHPSSHSRGVCSLEVAVNAGDWVSGQALIILPGPQVEAQDRVRVLQWAKIQFWDQDLWYRFPSLEFKTGRPGNANAH